MPGASPHTASKVLASPPSNNIPGPSSRRIEAGPSVPTQRPKSPPTRAQAYANAHNAHTARQRDTSVGGHAKLVPSKPIFEWITKKLTNRRATIGDITNNNRNATTTVHQPPSPNNHPHHATHRHRYPSLPRNHHPPPAALDLSTSRTRKTNHSRSESYSMESRSFAISAVSERRREMNNPYPSLPPPLAAGGYRESTIGSSFLSRSQTPSIRSEASLTSSMIPRRASMDDSFRLAGRADEDASVRPIPPSHAGSPTPSQSFITRSHSASLLLSPRAASPNRNGQQHRHRPETYHSTGSFGGRFSFVSTDSTDEERGRQSRQDSTSTKPTTIMSYDGPLPTTHIAQAAQTSQPSSPLRGSLSRDQPSNHVSQATTPTSPSPQSPTVPLTQAPRHTNPHPRDNPRPSSPPDPNASTLTLASSTFAVPPPGSSFSPSIAPSMYTTHRPSSLHQLQFSNNQILNSPSLGVVSPLTIPMTAPPLSTTPGVGTGKAPSIIASPSITWAPEADRNSMLGYPPSLHPTFSTSVKSTGATRVDRDASVRAVRRQGSGDSTTSGWSWKAGAATPVIGAGVGGTGGNTSSAGIGIPIVNPPDTTPRFSTIMASPISSFQDDTPIGPYPSQIPDAVPLPIGNEITSK